ncbi:MAG: hypothetical protein IMW92_12155, partial [Bacillales bacterium]|nr:hypothetical protein [Bacillales bacterium]
NENGVDVSSTLLGGLKAQPVSDGDKKVVYTANTSAKVSGKYAFSFPAGLVTDQSEAGNKSDAFNYTIDFGAGATTFDLSTVNAANNVITVDFGRAVKGGAVANSATDLANYTLCGKPLPEGTKIVLNGTQDIATITLPSESIEKTDPNAVFTVANVKSLNNELLNSYKGTVYVVDNVSPTLDTATLNNDGSVTLAFSEKLQAAPVVGDLVLTINNKELSSAGAPAYSVNPITVGADAGNYAVTVTAKVFDGIDGKAGTSDDILYIDVNGDGTYNSTDDIQIGSGATVTAGNVNLKTNSAITSVKIGTLKTGASTAADAQGNKLKLNVVKTVK